MHGADLAFGIVAILLAYKWEHQALVAETLIFPWLTILAPCILVILVRTIRALI